MRIFELFTTFTFNSIFQEVSLIPHLSHLPQIIIHSITFNLRQTAFKSLHALQSYNHLDVRTETSEWSIPTHFALSLQITEISAFEVFDFHRPQW